MTIDDKKDEEIAEIKRRLEYLVNSENISVTEKIEILKRALEIVEREEDNQQ